MVQEGCKKMILYMESNVRCRSWKECPRPAMRLSYFEANKE